MAKKELPCNCSSLWVSLLTTAPLVRQRKTHRSDAPLVWQYTHQFYPNFGSGSCFVTVVLLQGSRSVYLACALSVNAAWHVQGVTSYPCNFFITLTMGEKKNTIIIDFEWYKINTENKIIGYSLKKRNKILWKRLVSVRPMGRKAFVRQLSGQNNGWGETIGSPQKAEVRIKTAIQSA